MTEDILNLDTRRAIYETIRKNPGLHARKISELVGLSGQLTDYHLLFLEKHDIISSVKEGGTRRYYIKGKHGVIERKRFSMLRKRTPLRIILFLLQTQDAQYKDILMNIGVSKSTLSYHLQKLERQGLITSDTAGSNKKYNIVNKQEIMEFLIRYKPYSLIDGLKDIWVDLKWPGL
ncbi:MAG: winged helix-turn-helix transcriptional regulator [Candidatus Thermoplasmatota archaeon]